MLEILLIIGNHEYTRDAVINYLQSRVHSFWISLTCTAQPGHGGKRSDSPEGRVPSAITEILQVIDHEPTNLNETQ